MGCSENSLLTVNLENYSTDVMQSQNPSTIRSIQLNAPCFTAGYNQLLEDLLQDSDHSAQLQEEALTIENDSLLNDLLLVAASWFTGLQTLTFSVCAISALQRTEADHFLSLLSVAPILEEVEVRDDFQPGWIRVINALLRRTEDESLSPLQRLRFPSALSCNDANFRSFLEYRCQMQYPAPQELVVPFRVLFPHRPMIAARQLALGRIDLEYGNTSYYLFGSILTDPRNQFVCLESGYPSQTTGWPLASKTIKWTPKEHNRGRHFHLIVRRLDGVEGLQNIVLGCARITMLIVLDADITEDQSSVKIATLLTSLVEACSGEVRVIIHGGFVFCHRKVASSVGDVQKKMLDIGLRAHLMPDETHVAKRPVHILFDMSVFQDPDGQRETQKKIMDAWATDKKNPVTERFTQPWIRQHVSEIGFETSPVVKQKYREWLQLPDDIPPWWPYRTRHDLFMGPPV